MTEEKDLKTIPMEELTQMVSWMTIWDAEQLSAGKGWDDTSTKDSKESDTNDSDNSGDSNHFDKGEELLLWILLADQNRNNRSCS